MISKPLSIITLAAALLCHAGAGAAQSQSQEAAAANPSPAPSTGDTIVVEGNRDPQEERKQARSYIEAVEIGRTRQQTARWADKICPGVFGIEGEIADIMIERIRFIASSAGVPIADRDCRTNLSVIFAKDGAQFMAQVRRKSNRLLSEIPRHQRDFVLKSDAPVRWWYTTELTGSEGRPLLPNQPFIQCEGCEGGQGVPTGPNTRFNAQYSNSRIRTPTERHLLTASVVIDERQAAGTKVDSLAEYVALVALAEIWPARAGSTGDTILTLFDDAKAQTNPASGPASGPTSGDVRTLSEQDERFLCALYKLPLDRSISRQKSQLIAGLLNEDDKCTGFDEL